MFRKIALVFAATATLGAASLATTTTASAWHGGWHGHHHGHHLRGVRIGFYGPSYVAYDGCYMKKRWVPTAYGPRLRWVKVCY
jgi:hypothetical protein